MCQGHVPSRARDNFGCWSVPLEMHCNTKSAENGYILAAQYTDKLHNIDTHRQHSASVIIQM